jgi:GNAT superfamily N-acetyltransferase
MRSNQAIAYLCYGSTKELTQPSWPKVPIPSQSAYISCLYVLESYRRQKIGRWLLQEIEKDVKKRNFSTLLALVKNYPAKSPAGWTEFYLANGFRIVHRQGQSVLVRVDLSTVVEREASRLYRLKKLPATLTSKAKYPLPS